MAEDIRALTAELAGNPDSLAFLQLGEALRARGRLDAAAAVVRTGLERHPELPDAHDLYGRILADAENPDAAREAWEAALALAPRHTGALKGLAYLAYRGRDPVTALELLETALSTDPSDPTVVQALQTVRLAIGRLEADAQARTGADVFAGFEGAEHGLLLMDAQGLVMAGGLRDGHGRDIAPAVAAFAAGAAGEAQRAARLLDLGEWRSLVAEAPDGHLHVSTPAPGTVLLVTRDRAVPAGRLALAAQRAGTAARAWLEAQRG